MRSGGLGFERTAISLLFALTTIPARAWAQDASVDAGALVAQSGGDAGVGAAPSGGDAGGAQSGGSDAGGASDGAAQGDGGPTQSDDSMASRIRRAEVPQPFAAEALELAPGTILVRVLDARGQVVPDCPVRVGSMRDGERGEPVERRTGPDGLARFEGLERGSRVAYRVSTEHLGAKFGADPFQLPTDHGYQVQLVRLDVRNEPNSVLVTEARAEIGFQDDRVVLVQRFNLVNISTLGMDGDPRPYTFVPSQPLEFTLPPGSSAFRTDEQGMGMTDLRAEERDGRVRVSGSIPPTDPRNPVRLVWQSRVKFDGSDVPIELRFPELAVLAATVVAQAPQGMTLEVEGMPAAEERSSNGQRILITGRQRASRSDPNIDGLRIRLRNIPRTHGPERDVTAAIAMAIAIGSIGVGARRARSTQKVRDAERKVRRDEDLRAERERIVRQIRDLAKEHASGDVGPETYRRSRHELASALAAVDRQLAGLDAPPSPRV